MLLLILCALAIVTVAGALLFLSRRIRLRHRRFAAAAPSVDPSGPRLVDAPRALYHGTSFADGAALLFAAWKDACVCDLWCTEQALFVQREGQGALLAIPLGWVEDAALHRAFAPIAGKDLPMLRLRWVRGGEALVTELSLRGGMASLEALRREIHLRQKDVLRTIAERVTPP